MTSLFAAATQPTSGTIPSLCRLFFSAHSKGICSPFVAARLHVHGGCFGMRYQRQGATFQKFPLKLASSKYVCCVPTSNWVSERCVRAWSCSTVGYMYLRNQLSREKLVQCQRCPSLPLAYHVFYSSFPSVHRQTWKSFELFIPPNRVILGFVLGAQNRRLSASLGRCLVKV